MSENRASRPQLPILPVSRLAAGLTIVPMKAVQIAPPLLSAPIVLPGSAVSLTAQEQPAVRDLREEAPQASEDPRLSRLAELALTVDTIEEIRSREPNRSDGSLRARLDKLFTNALDALKTSNGMPAVPRSIRSLFPLLRPLHVIETPSDGVPSGEPLTDHRPTLAQYLDWGGAPLEIRALYLTDGRSSIQLGLERALINGGFTLHPDSRETTSFGDLLAESFDLIVADSSGDKSVLGAASSLLKIGGQMIVTFSNHPAQHTESWPFRGVHSYIDDFYQYLGTKDDPTRHIGYTLGATSMRVDFLGEAAVRYAPMVMAMQKTIYRPAPVKISSDLLDSKFQHYDLALHEHINPQNSPVTLLEGAAGNDVVRPFLSVNPFRMFAVTMDERPWDPEVILEVLNSRLSFPAFQSTIHYMGFKSRYGWVTSGQIDQTPFALALRAELDGMGVALDQVDVEYSALVPGAIVIRFPWRHPTEYEVSQREMVYIRGDITKPETYFGALQAYNADVHVYRHSASFGVPRDYLRGPDSFLNAIVARESARRVGRLIFATGDIAVGDGRFEDYSSLFPVLGARRIDLPLPVQRRDFILDERYNTELIYGAFPAVRILDLPNAK